MTAGDWALASVAPQVPGLGFAHTPLPLAWLLAGKLGHLLRGPPGAAERRRTQSDRALSVMCHPGGVSLTVLLPVPALDITTELKAAMKLPGGGLWVDHPQTVLGFGLLHFGTLARCGWRNVVLPPSALPRRRGAK